jgi:hypothetical protein
MLVDSGVTVNLMSHSMFKKLEREDDELMMTILTLNSMGATRWRLEASSPWSSSWGASRSLTCSSSLWCKVIIVLFLVAVGFTSIIVFLLLEVVHADTSTYNALADAMADWQHGSAQCLSGKDITGYDFFSVTMDGFVPMSVQPAFEARLGNVVFP